MKEYFSRGLKCPSKILRKDTVAFGVVVCGKWHRESHDLSVSVYFQTIRSFALGYSFLGDF